MCIKWHSSLSDKIISLQLQEELTNDTNIIQYNSI